MATSFDPAVLRAFEPLRAMSPPDLLQMAAHLDRTLFRAGAQICREGDEGDGCYLLASGSVSVTKNLPDGRRVHLATLPQGTLFGQSGLVPGQRRTADVRAETNVEVLSLSRRRLEWGLRQREPWAGVVQETVAVALVRQLRSALDRMEALAADENAGDAAVGRSRKSIPTPTAVDFRMARRPPPQPAPAAAAAAPASTPAERPAPAQVASVDETDSEDLLLPGGQDPASTQGLLALLAETEAAIADLGFDPEDGVSFVMDEDQRRTADARGRT